MRRVLPRLCLLGAVLAASTSGCESVPSNALGLTPETLERRQLQTRRFDGINEQMILSASTALFQDLGFNLDESEAELGLIVASKQRPVDASREIMKSVTDYLIFFYSLGAYGQGRPDKDEKIRVSLVVQPTAVNVRARDAQSFYVRVTFQRIRYDQSGKTSHVESIDDPKVYQEFFAKLSKSLFLTANQI